MMNVETNENEILAQKRAYHKAWREKNREKTRISQQRYWEKKALENSSNIENRDENTVEKYSIPIETQLWYFKTVTDKHSEHIIDLLKRVEELESKKEVIDISKLNTNHEKLKGNVTTKSYKIYENIANDFSKFAKQRKESVKDLISLALVEFMEKYDK